MVLSTPEELRGRGGAEVRADVAEGLVRAVDAFVARQTEEGIWPADYSGALFLVPMFVICARVAGFELTDEERAELRRYLLGCQNTDGGFGLHAEGPSVVFTTSLSYVALRSLGLESGDEELRRALEWMRSVGGVLGVPSWGKFVLCLTNLYSYDGIHPLLPELWLLPWAVPVHPGRLWCHARMVYLPMSYLYGVRAAAPVDELIEQIRAELYGPGGFEQVDWPAQRNTVARTDRHVLTGLASYAVNTAQARFERLAPAQLRKRALDEVLKQIRAEDENTHFIDIGPVNKMFNTLVWTFVAPGGVEQRRHFERWRDYLWREGDGLRVQGYNNTHLWDTAFALQALAQVPGRERWTEALRAGHRYIRRSQVLEDVPRRRRFYRDPSRGGWPFSDRDHGWPISDCTAEGLEVALELMGVAGDERIDDERLRWAAELLLFFQNADGGWASYERRRASPLLERINPAEVFGDIMVDYSYVECSAACIRALDRFRQRYPATLKREIDRAIAGGERFIASQQRPDGSWYGSWAVCFTYATWFGVWGLRAAGRPTDDEAIHRAVDFLLAHQRSDGGWGEHVASCAQKRWIDSEEGTVAQTSWALMALTRAGCDDRAAVDRGVDFLLSHRRDDGLWDREAMTGIFNQTCGLNYDNYRFIFPIWALSLYSRYLDHGVA